MVLPIFLIDFIVGTYRLSSHARLEAFVFQTKLNLGHAIGANKVHPIRYLAKRHYSNLSNTVSNPRA
jgi:hypothetical protein